MKKFTFFSELLHTSNSCSHNFSCHFKKYIDMTTTLSCSSYSKLCQVKERMNNQNEPGGDSLVNFKRDVKFVRKNIAKREERETWLPKHDIEKRPDSRRKRSIKRKSSKKLVFKPSNNGRNIKLAEESACNIENETPRKSEEVNSTREVGKRPIQIYKYESGRAGYPFIAFSKMDVPLVDRSETTERNEDDNSSGGSDTSSTDDERFTYNYQIYTQLWNDIEKGIASEHIPLPVFSDDINYVDHENVKAFVKDKSNLKIERIRWHPDKMKGVLRSCHMWEDEMYLEITHIFQIINRVYENI